MSRGYDKNSFQRENEMRAREWSNSQPVRNNPHNHRFGSIIRILFGCTILVLLLMYLVNGGHQVTFETLLNGLSNFTPFTFGAGDLIFPDHTITADWSVFNGFRNFLNVFVSLFDFSLGIVNCLLLLVQFAGRLVALIFSA